MSSGSRPWLFRSPLRGTWDSLPMRALRGRAGREDSARGPRRCAPRPIGAAREYANHQREQSCAISDRSVDRHRSLIIHSSPNPFMGRTGRAVAIGVRAHSWLRQAAAPFVVRATPRHATPRRGRRSPDGFALPTMTTQQGVIDVEFPLVLRSSAGLVVDQGPHGAEAAPPEVQTRPAGPRDPRPLEHAHCHQ